MRSEMTERIKLWTELLKKDFFRKVGTVKLHRMTTFENLGFERVHEMVRSQRRTPEWDGRCPDEPETERFYGEYPAAWGRKWEYGWFYGSFRLCDLTDEDLKGCRLELRPDVGGEMLAEINGELRGARDLQHDTITLTRCAGGDERYELLIESFSGNGYRYEHAGPAFFGEETVPEPPKYQVQTGECAIGVRNEEAYQLWLDMTTLSDLYRQLEPRSLRAQQLLEGLFEATRVMDFECTADRRTESYRKAKSILKPLLLAKNGPSAPHYSVFGQSHLDLAWKWNVEETRRKAARTYSNQLALLEEYPEYRFFGCTPWLLESMRNDYPALYDRVLSAIRSGKIFFDGGMYVEPDTQMPAGESLLRQMLYGQLWTREKLGQSMELVWLPDCFGFSGQLPQLMKACGIKYFATQKLARAKQGTEPFPYNDFLWEGIDGTRIQTHFFKKNNSRVNPEQFHIRWYQDRVQQERISEMLFPFGFGDGGGGATRDMPESIRRMRDLEGLPTCDYESPARFMKRLSARTAEMERERGTGSDGVNLWRGELYLSWHRGTFTGQAELKKGNRRAEQALREADLWCAAAIYSGLMPAEETGSALKALWLKLMFLQFHDVLPGTSIEQVNLEAKRGFEEIITGARKLSERAKYAICPNHGLIWNPIGIPRTLNRSVRVPACGYVSTTGLDEAGERLNCWQTESGTLVLQNSVLCAELSAKGELISLKRGGREFLSGPGNRLRLCKNLNTEYDAWELNTYYYNDENKTAFADMKLDGCGVDHRGLTAEAWAEFSCSFGGSSLTQRITLADGGEQVEFAQTVDWHETHELLQTEFHTIVRSESLTAETQYGYVNRPNHSSRQSDRDRFEGCMHRWCALAGDNLGVVILNDGKYGCSAENGTIRISLLRSSKIPDMNADMGTHTHRYAIRPYTGSFSSAHAAEAGAAFNAPLQIPTADMPAAEPVSRSFFAVANEDDGQPTNVLLDWVKTAEDDSGDLILRVYESTNSYETAIFRTPLHTGRVFCTNALEEETGLEELTVIRSESGTDVVFEMKPFEVKTIRISRSAWPNC